MGADLEGEQSRGLELVFKTTIQEYISEIRLESTYSEVYSVPGEMVFEQ